MFFFFGNNNNGENMENKSLWQLYMRKNYTNSLDKDINVDVLIIGGGITGLTTMYFLKDSNLNVSLVEKDHIGSGASCFTTGKLTYMQDLIYKNMNENIAKLYLDSQKEAINIVKDIVNKNNILCNLEPTHSYIFTDDVNKVSNFKKEELMYGELGIKYKSSNKIPIKFPTVYSIKVNDGYVFHPLKYLYSLKKIILNSNKKIYENTRIINISKEDNYYIANTINNKIKAKYIIICTQYPFFVNPMFLPLKSKVSKSYIICGNTLKDKKFQAISNLKPVNSIRYYSNNNKNYLIYGSRDIKNNINEEVNYKKQINKYKKYFNDDIKYYFKNQDIMTIDNLPLIGRINNSNLLIGTGYNKWGMTNGTIAGKILSDIVLGNDNKYIDLFRLNRSINIKNYSNLVIYNFSNISNYVLSKVKNNYSFYNDSVKIITKDGIKYGIYIDKKGKYHIVKNLCPHLKCNLIFNNIDKTWDCPCHGSRFSIDGKCIFGPSVYDISVDDL